MKIFITGGTGFVGSNLSSRLLDQGHEVAVASSSGQNKGTGKGPTYVTADTTKPGDWQKNIKDADVIINLAGRSIFHFWSESYKKQMYSSRVDTTRNIVDALPEQSQAILLSASAAGYYGDSGESERDEGAPVGSDFLATVCRDWEKEAQRAAGKGARVVLMRFGVVLGRGGGAIATMKKPFSLGLGGPIGTGRQWFPWIHLEDLLDAILFLMDGSALDGPFNCVAPERVRQVEFAKQLAGALKRPAFMPAPSFVMKTALGEFGKSLLSGQKAVPKKLTEHGFVFRYPRLESALQDILHG